MIDVYDPKHPDAPPRRVFASNIPAGYVPVSQSPADAPPEGEETAPKADPITAGDGNNPKE